MRVLTIVNERDAGPGVFADVALDAAHEITVWVPSEGPAPSLDGHDAVMAFGGSMNVDDEERHPWLRTEKLALAELVERGTPVLGVCLGAQMLAESTGGSATRASRPEIGWHEVEMAPEARDDPVVGRLPERFEAFQWHSYAATPPPDAATLASSPVSVQAYRVGERAWGIQFHAEVTDAIVAAWIADHEKDRDAVRLGIDPEALLAETRSKIERWNELGRAIAAAFLDTATRG